jgi:hypothetical protein
VSEVLEVPIVVTVAVDGQAVSPLARSAIRYAVAEVIADDVAGVTLRVVAGAGDGPPEVSVSATIVAVTEQEHAR